MIRAGTYDLCVLKAIALALKEGATAPDLSRCDAQFDRTWARAEMKAGGLCPTSGDASAIAAQVRSDANAIVAALMPPPTPTPCGGGIYPGCGGSCAPGLTCWALVIAGPSQSCACLASVATPCADTGGSVFAGPTWRGLSRRRGLLHAPDQRQHAECDVRLRPGRLDAVHQQLPADVRRHVSARAHMRRRSARPVLVRLPVNRERALA